MSEEVLYRYEDYLYAPMLDETDTPISKPGVRIVLRTFPITKKTQQGAWIDLFEGLPGETPKFVLLTAKKKFACKTKEDALESFIRRKESQIKILSRQLTTARVALGKAEDMWRTKDE
jgi:hypothetical protein